ncbi:hypothetical protein B0H13DRAFT_1890013 [Mycena leptocephala]|nr:hypothetical protein B0H13DRAFT_1890013 [Mycena leptocephala]
MAVLSFALILHAILLGSAALLPLVAAVPAELENRDTVITLEKSIKIIVSGDDVLRTQPPPPEVPPNQTPIVFLITCPPEKAEFGRRAFEDAYVLASTGRDYLQKTDNAYQHYFEDQDFGRVNDWFTTMMGHFQGQNIPNGFRINVDCETKTEPLCKDGETLAYVLQEVTVNPTVTLCNLFFDSEATRRTMGGIKWKDHKDRWCPPTRTPPYRLIDFETGGHTLLHELTHIQSIAMSAGFPSTNDPVCPIDVVLPPNADGTPSGGYYPWRARVLKNWWSAYHEGKTAVRPPVETWRNAESFAAAATEAFFLRECGYDNMEVAKADHYIPGPGIKSNTILDLEPLRFTVQGDA